MCSYLKIVTMLLIGLSTTTSYATKTLVFCSEASPAGFDPAQYVAGTDFEASADTVFNRLLQFKRGATTLEPALATSWSISKDGLTYTFHLRKGVKFHTTSYFKPTRDFNADDVVFTFSRMMNPRHLFRLMYPVEFPYFTDMGMQENLKKVVKVDEHTVQFILHKSEAPFLQNIAMAFASIHSFEYAQQLYKARKASNINFQPIGTGPFIFKRYIKDQQIRYLGNKQYWNKSPDGKVYLDELVFSITPEIKVRSQKMQAGECHLMTFPAPEDIKMAKHSKTLRVLSHPGFDVVYLSYNTQKPPLNQRLVRQALDMGINKKELVRVAHHNLAKLAVNMMPPAQWSYDTSLVNAPYDPLKAKALLRKAGYPNGFKIELWLQLGKHSANRATAELLQADWKKIGVETKVVSYEWGELLKRRARGEHQISLAAWLGDNGDPDNWLGILGRCEAIGGGNNYSRWCYLPFDRLITQARQTTDIATRIRLYQAAQKILKQEVPMSPLVHTLSSTIVNRSVKHYKKSVFGTLDLCGVDFVQ